MKKKILSFMVAFCLLACATVTSFAVSGKGTEANPFRISTADELLLLADFPECYFELENDIEFTGKWEPVADFSGSFDGKGHTITVSSYMLKENTGFFSTLSGTVKNLTIHANEMALSANSNTTNIGLFAGLCSGTISNCKATGSFTCNASGSNKYLGGICGEVSGLVEKTVSRFNTFAAYTSLSRSSYYYMYVGGICGILSGSITMCANMSNVILEASCYSSSSYYSGSYTVNYGGISSKTTAKATISDSMNLETSVSVDEASNYNNYYAGISYSNNGTITNCYSRGVDTTMTAKYGIAVGGTKTSCYYDKTVLGNSSTTYGSPKSTIAMKMEATYTDWDFENIWAIDESEDAPINSGYPYLRFLYEEILLPITISTASVVAGNIVIDSKITDVSTTCILHVALYDAENRLCSYLLLPNNRQLKDVFAVYPDNNAAYAKIFAWSQLEAMQPIAECETIQISR